jgi:hypothetical protein
MTTMLESIKLSPIALFAFNRPEHLKKSIDALSLNYGAQNSDLYIFLDGPRNIEDQDKTKAVENVCQNINGFKSVRVQKSEKNKGLANSIINGVSQLIEQHGRVIVLEDDMVTSPYFLKYMNEALDKYKDNEQVASIHAYVYPIQKQLPMTFFLRGADCWGWGTWAGAWKLFNPDGMQLLVELETRNLIRDFDFDHSYSYSQMLRDQIAGKNNSWAVRWHASAFLANKLTLYPGKTLISNIGLDSSGTHCADTDVFSGELSQNKIDVLDIQIEESLIARREFCNYFKSLKPKPANLFDKIWSYLARLVK